MKTQKSISDLQFIDFLPDSLVQTNLVWQWAVLVSRVVTKYLPAFKVFRKNVIFHIPHKYVEEMAQKSETVCALKSSTAIQAGKRNSTILLFGMFFSVLTVLIMLKIIVFCII